MTAQIPLHRFNNYRAELRRTEELARLWGWNQNTKPAGLGCVTIMVNNMLISATSATKRTSRLTPHFSAVSLPTIDDHLDQLAQLSAIGTIGVKSIEMSRGLAITQRLTTRKLMIKQGVEI